MRNPLRLHLAENILNDQRITPIQTTYKRTPENKLRRFHFKLLHRVLVANKELNRFGTSDSELRTSCHEFLQWFNDLHKTNV